MKWILLVEDDLSLINGLSFAVKKQGYMLDVAHTKDEADRLWENGAYDLLKLRTWILAMHLENSISGNNLIIKEQPFGTLCYY